VRRLAAGGRIDRGRTLRLRFDGRAVVAHPGDTLASALLAAGVSVVGRSFEYHRPRGVLAAGSEEPNALVTAWRRRWGRCSSRAGLWMRAGHFPRAGEDVGVATRREAAMVRAAVGVCDVSTLGKVAVLGPDAAAFLDRVYVNTVSTLAEGRVRYGVMLREDGFVLDDVVAARAGGFGLLVPRSYATSAVAEIVAAMRAVAARCAAGDA